eukprot:6194562-Pleurochrysis_carterae.AAC.3
MLSPPMIRNLLACNSASYYHVRRLVSCLYQHHQSTKKRHEDEHQATSSYIDDHAGRSARLHMYHIGY